MILHILPRAEWPAPEVRPASLATEGFVHCSDPGTVHMPANRLFAGRTDLVLLEIDPTRVGAAVRWEPGSPPVPGGPWFPHVYGPIPAAAVVAAHDFPPNPDGTFTLPAALADR
ncbi:MULTISPECIES: DUF952 domain-containing protein [Actinokineospora]|uniref:DUF952 domain-containing protein n=1 Tax=Actinokineospora fastidiosa TaxID=1816 RepID=A0A918G4U7_9PSEU|nr:MULTISPECIES: DUF952 domain-containing protein [Actinokineospora]UVS76415.1 hypothetical protein Actkin_00100 [Actinokineospora sp. UTMC 2448]GGS18362.1 hypothetical protein GCM10010171_08620 [Actinokineospora fastidiosa]